MPNRRNAIIELRKNAKRRDRNRSAKSSLKSDTAEFERILSGGNAGDSQKALEVIQASLDKSAKKGLLPKERVSRIKSRLAAKVNKLGD